MKDGLLSQTEYLDYKSSFESEVDALQKEISRLKEEGAVCEREPARDDSRLERFKRTRQLQALDRDILAELVNKVYVHANGRVEIQFRFRDPYEQILGLEHGG